MTTNTILLTKARKILYTLFFIFTVISCENTKNYVSSSRTESTAEKLCPIDIKSPKFFWLLQPWKDGKLATIDGWGRFAEISFIGANKIKITPLVNFPRTRLDRELITLPEAGIITSRTADQLHHIAAIDDKKTKSHVPMLTWRHYILEPVFLDTQEGLVAYQYENKDDVTDRSFFVYNYKEDRMVYEKENYDIELRIVMNDQYSLSEQCNFNKNREANYNYIFYEWKTGKISDNDLIKAINQSDIGMVIGPCRNIDIKKRFLFGYSEVIKSRVKLNWNEEYSDIKITPLSYLALSGKSFGSSFILSSDGMWATSLVGGYRGLNKEYLYKRAFFHLDDRYPNGISIPIITEDYEEYQWEYTAFVQHPVHGMCFAQEWHKEGKLYLRLYKMDDVLAEINRQLLEKAEGVLEK